MGRLSRRRSFGGVSWTFWIVEWETFQTERGKLEIWRVDEE